MQFRTLGRKVIDLGPPDPPARVRPAPEPPNEPELLPKALPLAAARPS